MKAMKFLLPGVVAGAISFAAPAIAQESFASHLYVGANGGQGHWRAMCPSGSSCEDISGTLAVFAGYQINPMFSAEASFRNYGELKGHNAAGVTSTIKGKGWDLSGLAAWPLTDWLSVYGRLGIYRSVLKGDGALIGAKESNFGPTYGAGLQFAINKSLALRGEWQGFSSMGGSTLPKGDLNVLTVGALWQFR